MLDFTFDLDHVREALKVLIIKNKETRKVIYNIFEFDEKDLIKSFHEGHAKWLLNKLSNHEVLPNYEEETDVDCNKAVLKALYAIEQHGINLEDEHTTIPRDMKFPDDYEPLDSPQAYQKERAILEEKFLDIKQVNRILSSYWEQKVMHILKQLETFSVLNDELEIDNNLLKKILKTEKNISLEQKNAALIQSVLHNDFYKVELFLSNGAYINCIDKNNLTPLLAAGTNRKIINFLLESGANPHELYTPSNNKQKFTSAELALNQLGIDYDTIIKEQSYTKLYKLGEEKYPSKEHIFYYLKLNVFNFLYENYKHIDLRTKNEFIEWTAELNYRLIKELNLNVYEDSKNKNARELNALFFGIDSYFFQDFESYYGMDQFFDSPMNYPFDHIMRFKMSILSMHKRELLSWNKSVNWYYVMGDIDRFQYFKALVNFTKTENLLRASHQIGEDCTHDFSLDKIDIHFKDMCRYHMLKPVDEVRIFCSFVNLSLNGRYSWKLKELGLSRV